MSVCVKRQNVNRISANYYAHVAGLCVDADKKWSELNDLQHREDPVFLTQLSYLRNRIPSQPHAHASAYWMGVLCPLHAVTVFSAVTFLSTLFMASFHVQKFLNFFMIGGGSSCLKICSIWMLRYFPILSSERFIVSPFTFSSVIDCFLYRVWCRIWFYFCNV